MGFRTEKPTGIIVFQQSAFLWVFVFSFSSAGLPPNNTITGYPDAETVYLLDRNSYSLLAC